MERIKVKVSGGGTLTNLYYHNHSHVTYPIHNHPLSLPVSRDRQTRSASRQQTRFGFSRVWPELSSRAPHGWRLKGGTRRHAANLSTYPLPVLTPLPPSLWSVSCDAVTYPLSLQSIVWPPKPVVSGLWDPPSLITAD